MSDENPNPLYLFRYSEDTRSLSIERLIIAHNLDEAHAFVADIHDVTRTQHTYYYRLSMLGRVDRAHIIESNWPLAGETTWDLPLPLPSETYPMRPEYKFIAKES